MGEHELHALAEPAVVMAHGLGGHSPQLDAAVAVTELVLTLFKLFARARSSLEEAKLGVRLLAEVTVTGCVPTSCLDTLRAGWRREENS